MAGSGRLPGAALCRLGVAWLRSPARSRALSWAVDGLWRPSAYARNRSCRSPPRRPGPSIRAQPGPPRVT
jgi:hypothetical protein